MPSLETHPAPAKRPALLLSKESTGSWLLRLKPLPQNTKFSGTRLLEAWVAAKVEIRGRGGFS